MPLLHLTSFIAAPVEVVFDLCRHIDLHKRSMAKYREEAVAGTRFGLIENNDTVTWKARHLFKSRFLRVKITDMKKPEYFTDVQLQGDFRMMKHEHHFKSCENGTIMIDLFYFETPYGWLGRMFNQLFLTAYIKTLLEQRIKTIKEYAESGMWKKLLVK